MALKIQQQYTTQADALYSMAQGSKYFDESAYSLSLQQGRGDEFIMAVLGTEDATTPETFNNYYYNKLQGTDKLDYLSTEFYLDRNQTDTDEQGNTYNVYDKAIEYFDYQVEQIEAEEIYNNMSGFEKGLATAGVMLGEAFNAVYSTIENVLDALTLAGGVLADAVTVGQFHEEISEGTKWAISQDLTGTGAIGDALSEFRSKYTAIDENGILKFLDDVIVGTAQMAPLFIPGGNVVYMTSMAGMSARDAIQNNPDIDLLNLTAYTALTTGLEYGTEWLSGKIFGGADFIGSKLTGQTMRQSTSLLKRLGLDFTSEFMEESISEFIGSALDVWLVGGPNSQYASFTDVLYAGLIGGTIGGLLSGANVATTRNMGVTKDGKLVDFKTARDAGLDVKKLSKIDTLNLQSSLQEARVATRANQVEEFYAKYQQRGLTRQQAQERHQREYNKAVEAQKEQQKALSDGVAVLSKVMQWAGVKGFAKGVNLANATIEQKSRLIREYTEYKPSTVVEYAKVEGRLNALNPDSKATIVEDMTASQLQIKDKFKSEYGVDVYFANYAERDGNVKNHNVVIDENTIVLDSNMFENADYDYIINKVAKQMLIETLQYRSGVLSRENINKLKRMLFKQQAYNESRFDTAEYLDSTSVDTIDDSELEFYAKKQAELLSQMLLFDKFTINKVFIGSPNIFMRIYDWLKGRADFFKNLGKKNAINKIQYNYVLKTLRSYEDAVVEYSPSRNALEQAMDVMRPNEFAGRRMVDNYDDNKPREFKDWGFIPEEKSQRAQTIYQCRMDLNTLTKGQFTYEDAFNPDIYPSDFIAEISANQEPGQTFEYVLQEYLLRSYGLQIDTKHQQLVEAIHFRNYSSSEFQSDLNKLYNNRMSLEEFRRKYQTVGDIFNSEFDNMIFNEDTGETLRDVDLIFVGVDRANHPDTYGYTETNSQTGRTQVVVYIDTNITKTKDRILEFSELEHTIYHETQHIISNWTNLPAGGSPKAIADALIQQNPMLIKKIWDATMNISYEEAVEQGYTAAEIRNELAEYIYDNLAGELLASGDSLTPTEIFTNKDTFDIEFGETTFKITGYGRFSDISFEGAYPTDNIVQQRADPKKNPLRQIKGQTTQALKDLAKEGSWINDSKDLIDDMNYEENGVEYISGVGDVQATNEAIRLAYPDNKYATTVEYVDEVINVGLAYAEQYAKIAPKNEDPNTPHTLEEIKPIVDAWYAEQQQKDAETIQKLNEELPEAARTKEGTDKLQETINKLPSKVFDARRESLPQDIKKTVSGKTEASSYERPRRIFLNADFNYSINDTNSITSRFPADEKKRKKLERPDSSLNFAENTDEGSGGSSAIDVIAYNAGLSTEQISDTQNYLELSNTNAAETLEELMPKVSLNATRGFAEIEGIRQYAKSLEDADTAKVNAELDRRNWKSKKEYETEIKTIKDDLASVKNLTYRESQIVNTDTSKFTTPQQYIDYLADLNYVLDSRPRTEQELRNYVDTQLNFIMENMSSTASLDMVEELIRAVEGTSLSDETLARLNEADLYTREEYRTRINELKDRVVLQKNLTEEERALLNTNELEFTTVEQYRQLLQDLQYVLEEHPTTEQQVQQVVKETAPEVRETATKRAKETAKKPKAKKQQQQQQQPKRKKSAIQIEKDKRKETSRRVKEQTIPVENLKINTKENTDNVSTIKNICNREGLSQYQGELRGETYNKVSTRAFTRPENREFFENLTGNDIQSMLHELKQQEVDAKTNEELEQIMAAETLLLQYAYTNRNKQFKEIKDWIMRMHRINLSNAGRQLGLWSSAGGFSRGAADRFRREMSKRFNQEIEFTDQLMEETITDGVSLEEFKTSLLKRINQLNEQIKNEKDPQRKWELQQEVDYCDNLYDLLQDGEYAQAIDLFTEHLRELDTNQAKNEEKIAEVYKKIIDFLVQNIDETGQFREGTTVSILSPENKARLLRFWSSIRSFRYLAMLSSPTTAGKNAISNTAVAAQAIIEDLVLKGLENTQRLYQPSQLRYTGNFDDEFSNYVDEYYGARINSDTNGDKYNASERDSLKTEYAKETDPIRKSKILGWLKRFQEKMLNDKPWTRRRTKRNLKNTLAGSHQQILYNVETTLGARYGINVNPVKNPNYQTQLINKIAETNPELAREYANAISSNSSALTSIVKLGNQLKLDIMEQIYQKSLYRANKLFFKLDNWFSRTESRLRKTHPVIAEMLSFIQPFVRVAANTTIYTIDRSPIGLVKGFVKYLKTNTMYLSDMRQEITNYYKEEYYKQMSKNNKNFTFKQEEFANWYSKNCDTEVVNALNGDKQAIKNVAQKLIDNGLISHMAIGASDIFARADTLESISQGMVGTSLMVVGIILAAVLDNFDYEDDDDYLGPILRIGNVKIRLTDLAPFSTMFVVGAMIGTDNVDDKFETIFSVLADQTLLNVVESALTYSNSLTDYLENQTINSIQSFIPTITRNIARIWGAKKDKSGNFWDKLWKTTLSNTMFFNYLVADKVNPYTGEPEKYYESGFLEGIFNLISPIGYRVDVKSELEREAERLGAETTGSSGSYTINGNSFSATGKTKENLNKFRAEYLTEQYDKIVSGDQLVTVKQEDGTYITTTYNRLTDEQKANVLQNLYSKASDITKIKYWLDSGNLYYENNRNKYLEYRAILTANSLVYRPNWSGSKFVER